MKLIIDDAISDHTLINTFVVAPEQQTSVIALLRRFTEQHAHAMRGFIGAGAHASLDGRRVVNYVQWETEADLAAMLATRAARAHMAELGALSASVTPVLYKIAYVGSRPLAGD